MQERQKKRAESRAARADSDSTEWRGGRERKGTTAAREGNSLERVSVGMAATIRSALGLVKKKMRQTGVAHRRQKGRGARKTKKRGRE